MKKLIGTVVLAALVAGAAFAELNVGAGFNRAVFAPIGYDGEVRTYQTVSFGSAPRIAVGFSGASDQAGFSAAIKFDGGNLDVNDDAYIWVKPFDWLKIQAGQWFDGTLRGGQDLPSGDWLRPSNRHGDDLTFAYISHTGDHYGSNYNPVFGATNYLPMKGVELVLTPIEGLYVAAALNTGYTADKSADVFKRSVYQAGYTIADTATIKAQYIGTEHGYGWINAAVDLLMIENQKIALGAYIPTDSKKAGNNTVDIGATYHGQFDALGLSAYVLFGMYKDAYNFLGFGVGVDYDLGDGLSVGGDVRADITLWDSRANMDTKMDISAGVFLKKGLSNGVVGIGAQVSFANGEEVGKSGIVNATTNLQGMTANDKVHFAVPVMIQVGF